jgi:HTH-type transcriptional regulator/antitoxin HigA
MKIKSESEFRNCQERYEAIIQRGTALGNMELLGAKDKAEFVWLSQMINEWEAAHHPLPGRVSTLITDAIKERIKAENLKQKEIAETLGVSESRISDLLNGRRPLNLNIVKRLRDNLGIPADFILDNL